MRQLGFYQRRECVMARRLNVEFRPDKFAHLRAGAIDADQQLRGVLGGTGLQGYAGDAMCNGLERFTQAQ